MPFVCISNVLFLCFSCQIRSVYKLNIATHMDCFCFTHIDAAYIPWTRSASPHPLWHKQTTRRCSPTPPALLDTRPPRPRNPCRSACLRRRTPRLTLCRRAESRGARNRGCRPWPWRWRGRRRGGDMWRCCWIYSWRYILWVKKWKYNVIR